MERSQSLPLSYVGPEHIRGRILLDVLVKIDLSQLGEQLHLVLMFLIDVHLIELVSGPQLVKLEHIIELLFIALVNVRQMPELHLHFVDVEVALRSLL